jgi:hypothetical protein
MMELGKSSIHFLPILYSLTHVHAIVLIHIHCCLDFLNIYYSIHKVQSTLNVLNDITKGSYALCSPYSPRLKPIERGFGLVWNEIRSHGHEAQRNPITVINRSFQKYSIFGTHGHACTFMLLFSML